MTREEFLNLIPAANRDKPKFIATVDINIAVPVRVQQLLESMIPLFDVDLAVGQQLDVIGQWAGISRIVNVPIPGVYFEWDGAAENGWDFGTWQPDGNPTEVTILPDDTYRLLVKAKIAANRWDGTTDQAYAIWEQVFTTLTILIQDKQDMTYKLGFYGAPLDSLTLQLVIQGYIPLKPEGVRLAGVFTPVTPTSPMFSWDSDTDILQGWDEGSWVNEYTT